MFTYEASGATDIGLRRSSNEDAYFISREAGIMAVADGMGGAAAGEIASSIFVAAAAEVMGPRGPATAEQGRALVQQVFGVAGQRMVNHIRENPDHGGMGCTAELLGFCGDRYFLGHVGDSRTYLFRNGKLRQITKDHSLVQEQLDQGQITAAEAVTHRMKHVVLRALCADMSVSIDLVGGTVYSDDLFLLCSDGLTDMVDDAFIREVLASQQNLKEKVVALVDGAKAAGGKDNVTVVLCQVSI